MNRENILKLADAIEKNALASMGVGFELNSFFDRDGHDMFTHRCGTTACIAGWACIVLGHVDPKGDVDMVDWHDDAASLLELGIEESKLLFIPLDVDYEHATPDDAVMVLRRLADTGVVSWKETKARRAYLVGEPE